MNVDDVYLALDRLGSKPLNGVYFRHTAPKREPLSGEGARIVGGRWNRPGSEALYLAEPTTSPKPMPSPVVSYGCSDAELDGCVPRPSAGHDAVTDKR